MKSEEEHELDLKDIRELSEKILERLTEEEKECLVDVLLHPRLASDLALMLAND